MLNTQVEIEIEIEKKRRELVSKTLKYGFSSEVTVKCSQELDNLLNSFEKLNPTKRHVHRR